MTAEQLLTADLPTAGGARSKLSGIVETIRSSFALVEPHADDVARHFYATLFGLAPETRDLFPPNMEVQRSRLLRALMYVVQMVDQPDDLMPFLEQLGRDHRKFGVLPHHYDVAGGALLSAVREFAGPGWTPGVERAWTDAF